MTSFCVYFDGPRRADEEQADAVDVFRRIDRAGGLEREQVRDAQAEAGKAQRTGVQEVAPREAVTEVHRLVGVELDHGWRSPQVPS